MVIILKVVLVILRSNFTFSNHYGPVWPLPFTSLKCNWCRTPVLPSDWLEHFFVVWWAGRLSLCLFLWALVSFSLSLLPTVCGKRWKTEMTQNRWYNLSSVKDVLKCHFIASVMQEIVKQLKDPKNWYKHQWKAAELNSAVIVFFLKWPTLLWMRCGLTVDCQKRFNFKWEKILYI